MAMRIYPVSEFRNTIRERLQEARESQDPLYIAYHGRPQVVVLDIEAFERLVNELNEFRSVVHRLQEWSQQL